MPKRKSNVAEAAFAGAVTVTKLPTKAPKPSRQTAQHNVAQRYLDEDTRRAVQLARLDALEADNFGEDKREPLNLEANGLYVDDSEATGTREVAGAGKKKRKAAAGACSVNDSQRRLLNAQGFIRRADDIAASEAGAVTDEFGRLQRQRSRGGLPVYSAGAVLGALGDAPTDAAEVREMTGVEETTGNTAGWAASSHHYLLAAAPPSKRPAVPFCGVCGDVGRYTCAKCGARLCTRTCSSTHAETRCMK